MQGYAMDSGPTGRLDQALDVCYPYGFIGEFKALFRLAWPTSLSILFHYFIQPISLMFCGHLGKTELASAAMAISVIYMTSVSVGRGLAFGGDTFFSQTYGSSNKKRMGVYLQKALIFGVMCACCICAVLLNTETILLLLRQDPQVARLAQEYTQLFMPGALAYCWIFTLMRYLLCQNSVIPNLLICVSSCGVNALLHYALVVQAGMGIRGSAISLCLTYYLVFFLLFSYIWASGIYRETWAGWTWECLDDWGSFSRVALSSIFMTFIFWLCTEVGTFLSGLLGEKQIGAFSICFQVEGFAWMIPLGIGGACTARVGQYLGANQPLGAITTCRVAITLQGLISVVMGLLCYLLRWFIPEAFTSNDELIGYTANLMQLVAIYVLLEGISGVGVSIARGTGHQTLGAVIIFVSYYIFALPIGVPLMFATMLGLAGLWWGYIIGLFVQNLFLLIFVARVNWQKEADNAQVRAGVDHVTNVTINRTMQQTDQQIEEATEQTRLLGEPTPEPGLTVSVSHLVLKRLVVFAVIVGIVGTGIATRLFIHLDNHSLPWQLLCVPTSTMPSFHGEAWSNVTLPPCNLSSSNSHHLPLYTRVYV